MSDYFSNIALAGTTLTFNKVKEEIERLRAENEQLKFTSKELRNDYINSDMNLKLATDMIEQLKEALKKIDPMTGEKTSRALGGFTVKCCCFCEAANRRRHADDCEYVRLTGGAE